MALLVSWGVTFAIWCVAWTAYSRHKAANTRLMVDLRVILLGLFVHLATFWTTSIWAGIWWRRRQRNRVTTRGGHVREHNDARNSAGTTRGGRKRR